MIDNIVKKVLVFAVILLFIGVAIQPGISTRVLGIAGVINNKVSMDNHPPYEPSNPYPENGSILYVPIFVTLIWTGGDPDTEDNVTYNVYFGFDNPPKYLIFENRTNTFYNLGELEGLHTYYWKIVAWDNHDASTEGPIWHFSTNVTPVPPPPIINGPQQGKVGIEYEYTFFVEDNGCNNISIYVDWGDGKTNRTAFIEPGIEIKLNHTWYDKGNYIIIARSRDIYGVTGGWETLSVTMPRSKQNTINWWFQLLLDRFPFLQRVLNIMGVYS
jgi:hypothetical protein